MYRIKLTNGTVLEFDSLDALTVDIHAGVVDADALIFHQRANQWLPIHVHPAWKHAMAAPRKTPPAAKPAGATPPRGSAAAPASTTGSAPAAALRPLPRAAQSSAEKPATPAPKGTTSSTGPSPSATGSASASAAASAGAGLASLDLDLIEPEESAPAPAPATKSAPKAKPAPTPAPTATAVETPKPAAASPAAKSAPRPAAAPTPKATAGTEPPKTVSVDSLDEVLELIAPEELEVPAPPPAIAPRPAPKAPPRQEAAPIVQVAAQASATNAALAALGRDAAPEASTPAPTPTEAPAQASAAQPTVPAEAPAPATAAQPAAPVALPVPAPTASADTLVPSPTLLVVPVEESVTLAAPAPERATSDRITTTDLASDFAIEVHPLPAPEPVESPVAVEEPLPAFTTTAEHALPSPVTAAPGPRPPNRTLWYVGGALAAGVAITAIALGGRGKDDAAAPVVATEQRSANPALPGAPLAPPAAPGGDLAPVLGRIEPPAEPAPEPAESDAAARSDARAPESRKARDEATTAKPAREAKADRGAKTELAEAKAADEKKGKGDSAKPARTGDDGVIVAPSADFKSLGTIAVKADVNPSVLASRYASAHDAAWNDLVARLRLAGFDNLFAPARTAPSGASSARASVAAARAHIAQWRTRTSTIEKAYRDSSASLTAAGQWDAEEQKAWEGRGRRGESGESAQQVNAILAAADRLFFILAANASGYEAAADGLRFTDSGAQRDYWEARRTFLAAAGAAGSAEPRTPLAAVLKALGGRPPEGVNAN